jgi:hypothetical protein
MLAGLVVAIPVIVAAVIAAMALLMVVTIFWAVLAIVTWKLLGHRRGLPGPWWLYTRRRQLSARQQAMRNAHRAMRRARGFYT